MSTDPTPPDDDALWREIVENYGEHPRLDEQAPPAAPGPAAREEWREREEHYVPPEPPPVGWPTGPRAVACVGLFGGPLLIMVMLLFGVTVPTWLGWFALLGFIGGFGFLVSTVRSPEEWDDGSQV